VEGGREGGPMKSVNSRVFQTPGQADGGNWQRTWVICGLGPQAWYAVYPFAGPQVRILPVPSGASRLTSKMRPINASVCLKCVL